MKTKFYLLIICISLLLIWLINKPSVRVNQHEINVVNATTTSIISNKNNTFKVTHIPLKKLGIEVLKTLENEYYVLTAYDIVGKDNLIYVGSYEGKNVVRFFDLKSNIITKEFSIKELPLDVYSTNDTCYVLTDESLILLNQDKILAKVKHNISNILTYDRLLTLDDKLFISMSDGSSYSFEKQKLLRLPELYQNRNRVWIQKTSNYSFSIETAPNNIINYKDELSLGSMTVLGGDEDNIVCIIEQITNLSPLEVNRKIAFSDDNFINSLENTVMQNYSYLKNDIRLHNNHLYHLLLQDNEIILTHKKLEL